MSKEHMEDIAGHHHMFCFGKCICLN